MKKKLFITVITLLLLTSCSFGKPAEPTVDPMIAALEGTIAVQNAAATMLAQQAAQTQAALPPTPEPTEAPPTEAPTLEPTATVEQPVRATANVNANCRFGPYANFAVVEILHQGATADVIGQNNANGQWWKVKLASGSECWIYGPNLAINGDTSKVAQVVSPATPTPVPPPNWNGTWTLKLAQDFQNAESAKVTLSVNMVQTGNELRYSFSLGPSSFNAYLTVSADGMSAAGSLNRNDGLSWSLKFIRNPDNLSQFRGKWYWPSDQGLDGDNCGYKDGAGFPEPCRP